MIALAQQFELINCYSCGVAFAIPDDLQRVLRETHRNFYCPNGHSQCYLGKSKAEELQERLNSAARQIESAKAAQLQAETQLARMAKRVSRGVCPCCNRTFENLARHMDTKHKTQNKLACPGPVKAIA